MGLEVVDDKEVEAEMEEDEEVARIFDKHHIIMMGRFKLNTVL